MQYAVEMNHITRIYPGVVANDDVSVKIKKGSVLCLVGENGAGKSTLMKILYGLEKPDSGTIILNGKPVSFHSSRDAIKHKIGMVHQHFMLIDEISVLENIILGMEPQRGFHLDYKCARKRLTELARQFDMPVPLDTAAGELPVGVQQKVEILKAMYRGADILILDEPTAVLTPQETEKLFETIRSLAKNGHSIVLITHKLDEVMQVADDIVVMRRGKVVGEFAADETDAALLAVHMVGNDLPKMIDKQPGGNRKVLSLHGVTLRAGNAKPLLDDLSMDIHAGEVLGIAGVSGNGQSELANVIAGLCEVEEGEIYFGETCITHTNRLKRLEMGINYIPEDRGSTGLCLSWPVSENLIAGYHRNPEILKHGFINQKKVDSNAAALIQDFDIRTPDLHTNANKLSGGNQQKIIIARESTHGARLLIAAEPTRGVDIGAISFIHNHILSLRNKGVGVLLISSDLDEIFKLSDRIAVLYEGQIALSADANTVSREELGLYMAGVKKEAGNHV